MKKIFISIPWFHPAFRAGGPIQSIANLVNEFAVGIEYRIFCGNTDLNNIALEGIEPGKWTVYNAHTQVWYAAPENRSSTVTGLLDEYKPDVLFMIGMFSWHFTLVPLIFGSAKKKIISARGMLQTGALSQKSGKKKIFLGLFKMLGMQKKASFHATDEAERLYIKNTMGENVVIHVAGNFPRKFRALPAEQKMGGGLNLVSVGLISPMKNYLPVLKALHLCKADIAYDICGPVKDMLYWQQCLAQIKVLPPNIKVNYHGDVQPQKIGLHLQEGHVFILPSKSENFGHAFYEALSAGKPVITSKHTPWNELKENKAGWNIDPSEENILEAVNFFAAMDQPTYESWSRSAVAYADGAIDASRLSQQYTEMFSLPS